MTEKTLWHLNRNTKDEIITVDSCYNRKNIYRYLAEYMELDEPNVWYTITKEKHEKKEN